MLAGKGVKIYLIVENRTKEPLSIHGTFGVNGVIVENDYICASKLIGKAKVIVELGIFYRKLSIIDVSSIDDIESFSYGFWSLDMNGQKLNNLEKLKDMMLPS